MEEKVFVLIARYHDNSGFKVLCVYQEEDNAKRDKELILIAGTDQIISVHEVEWVGN